VQSFMMWGHDDALVEGKDKGLPNVMSWLQLAEELHASAEEMDLDETLSPDTAVSA
jgi:hypothetical protein